jgi:hypothetical protein
MRIAVDLTINTMAFTAISDGVTVTGNAPIAIGAKHNFMLCHTSVWVPGMFIQAVAQ